MITVLLSPLKPQGRLMTTFIGNEKPLVNALNLPYSKIIKVFPELYIGL
jgi:hypothetical protein